MTRQTTVNRTGHIVHLDEVIEYEIQTRPRVTRNIHLKTAADGGLVVVAPPRMSQRAIRKRLQRVAHKVARFLVTARTRLGDLKPLRYRSGEQHLFLGVRYPLQLIKGGSRRSLVQLVDDRIVICAPDDDPDQSKRRLRKWYRQQATEYFGDGLKSITATAPWTNGQVPTMRLRRMKRTWGSCSSKGIITLNPHLVKAPPPLINYVIAHEVCHLAELNHGRAFYALQTQLNPCWREQRAKLHSEGHVFLHD